MNSNLLESIGLGTLDIAYVLIVFIVLIVILFVLYILQIAKYKTLDGRLSKFMTGKKASNLEEEIKKLFEDNEYLTEAAEASRKDIRKIYKNLELCYQKTGVKKYDAFHQMGGKLSFCLVQLDQNNNGYIINSVHSTDGCYTYVKEVEQGECKLPLGDEEREALEQAL
jgi:hypothetical protein